MGHATIRLTSEPGSARKVVSIKYDEDASALPQEHEEEHRKLINKLFEGGIIKQGDKIVVERVAPSVPVEEQPNEPQGERASAKSGQ